MLLCRDCLSCRGWRRGRHDHAVGGDNDDGDNVTNGASVTLVRIANLTIHDPRFGGYIGEIASNHQWFVDGLRRIVDGLSMD